MSKSFLLVHPNHMDDPATVLELTQSWLMFYLEAWYEWNI